MSAGDDRDAVLAARSYGELRERLSGFDCRACALHRGRTHLVVDRGSSDARLLLVGEAPGAEEDLQGRAFVGRSGRLLDAVLQRVGLDPERDVLIANIAKCRPPGNRPPTREEAAACAPYLDLQIALLQPEAIVLLGKTAVAHLAPERRMERMSDLVGRRLELERFGGIDVYVTFHPAYVLRSRSKEPEFEAHLAQAALDRTP